MPFTVEDFEDLLRLLYERPDWRDRLQRVILPPELFELPRLAQELAEANRAERERVARLEAEQQATRVEVHEGFAQTGERLSNVGRRVEGVETNLAAFRTEANERFDHVDERFDRVDERFARVDERFDRVDARLLRMSDDLGSLKGSGMEQRFRERIADFRHMVPQPVALSADEVANLLDHEVTSGRLLPGDARRIERADLVVRGGPLGAPRYLVVEVSWLVAERDVRRALERAQLLQKAGYAAQGVVAGAQIQDDARVLAERLAVGRVIEAELDGEDVEPGAIAEP